MDQSSAAACPKSPSSACTDGDKVKKADDVSSSSCSFTTNAPTNTECEASSDRLAGVNQDRNLSVATEDSRRSSTGDVDEPAKPACEQKAACGEKSSCEKKTACEDEEMRPMGC
ncbi:hypothetical protein B0T21DRAFT_108276 [Apiosordaria backusii]|uniref:Uncharacterized protein n=1 Tax=Apiosordaria backusii TaxID=314023 RepID=A0AA39ZSJ4_9PEZI|nr:hypothetical protein B0T21DRAFT_108276 [Apiosordaria backusii]